MDSTKIFVVTMETEASKEEEEKKKEVANQEEEDNKKEAAKQEEEDEEYLTKAYKNDNPRLDDYLQMALKWAEQKQHAKEEMAEYLEKLTTLPEKVAAVKENASAVTALGCLLAERGLKAARASKKEAKVAFYEYAAVCFHRGAQLKDSAAMRNLGTLYSGTSSYFSCLFIFFMVV